jgi:hypothetical protein
LALHWALLRSHAVRLARHQVKGVGNHVNSLDFLVAPLVAVLVDPRFNVNGVACPDVFGNSLGGFGIENRDGHPLGLFLLFTFAIGPDMGGGHRDFAGIAEGPWFLSDISEDEDFIESAHVFAP